MTMPSKQKKWLITENDSAPGGKFKPEEVIKEEDDHEDPKKWTHSFAVSK